MSETVTGDWVRLSPAAMAFFAGRFIKGLFSNAIAVIPGFIAWFSATDSSLQRTLVSAGIALTAVMTLYAVVSYLRFQYRLGERNLQVRRGVFVRENTTVELARIQNVSTRDPWYTRWLTITILGVETAGSGGQELTLPGVPRKMAKVLRAHRSTDTSQQATTQTDRLDDPTEPLVSLSMGDVVRYGLSHYNFVVLAIIIGFASQFDEGYGPVFQSEIPMKAWEWLKGLGVVSDIVLAIALVAGALLIMMTFSTCAAILAYHGYALRRDGSRFIRQSGLLTRHEQSLSFDKIQAVEVRQNLFARWLGIVSLVVRQTEAGNEEHQQQQGRQKRFIVPGISLATAQLVIREVYANGRSSLTHGESPTRAFISRSRWYVSVPIALGVAGALFAAPLNPLWAVTVFVVLAGLLEWLTWMEWRRFAVAVNGDLVYWRSGIIGTRLSVFPSANVQRVDCTQTRSHVRKGLCKKLRVHLPSHSVSLPYCREQFAFDLRNLLLASAQMHDQVVRPASTSATIRNVTDRQPPLHSSAAEPLTD